MQPLGFCSEHIERIQYSYPPPTPRLFAQALACPSTGPRLTIVFLVFSDRRFCGAMRVALERTERCPELPLVMSLIFPDRHAFCHVMRVSKVYPVSPNPSHFDEPSWQIMHQPSCW